MAARLKFVLINFGIDFVDGKRKDCEGQVQKGFYVLGHKV